jgi:DNA modification methylase
MEGRRFLGGDLDPAYVETTRRRLVELAAEHENDEAGA